ncbi:hypothetical protein [Actinophytocola xanthii]|uniref:Uncharacterized protein n=1 Tax=Actinophytocola xanthii TaxID=1912961 RepID=A0A1Q8CQR8_9PSEU|nr:hypothetical protein [Actinophytocola xanthii]OLF16706.1 hypothetical protein BU204_15365 [Actinophytocola xanthii]
MTAYAFKVPNPFGVCAVGQVAVVASSRKEAVQRIKAEGLKVGRGELGSPLKLTDTDLATIEQDPRTIWIRGVGLYVNNTSIDDDPWRPVAQFRGPVRVARSNPFGGCPGSVRHEAAR